jgi:hypothetical protein
MRLPLATLLTLFLVAPALAHDDATLDAMATPHGGQLRMAGPYHFELVVGEGQVRVYLSDHADKPVSSQGVSGNAVMLSGDKSTIALAPAGENLLQGAGAFTSGPDMKVVVSLTFPDGKAWQARFTPGARMQGTSSVPATAPAGGHDMHRH